MRFENREKDFEVDLPLDGIRVVLDLWKGKFLTIPEQALKAAGYQYAQAFHHFSTADIAAAIDDAIKNKDAIVKLVSVKREEPKPAPAPPPDLERLRIELRRMGYDMAKIAEPEPKRRTTESSGPK